ncbi:uncharacterized protein MYCFIDRAFT_170936 [Pseudocercospora fijiensis CIRAD86]|uniref:Uncharacterized protein n=1 Tax=Pseudocercospora fijiensis (strain CIRAD86) TaxID=383855 RepID=N1QCK9_PSEFD|nr:uncharacterized protein MYCFIDRAFT_170936 [Pseudocercospora fijiensis CIRAD86]EME89477.1 hypothetical protein MYCFIDRAFT_170936 [Pseudocercospora fijiensis CIRAD86]
MSSCKRSASFNGLSLWLYVLGLRSLKEVLDIKTGGNAVRLWWLVADGYVVEVEASKRVAESHHMKMNESSKPHPIIMSSRKRPEPLFPDHMYRKRE